ncbi:hypothetical protein SODG_000233 [Sodalis praecaptivus]|nr:hypothetical protein NVIRENTERO_03431 [Sodalis praecaptivus]
MRRCGRTHEQDSRKGAVNNKGFIVIINRLPPRTLEGKKFSGATDGLKKYQHNRLGMPV